ncbi:MAG: mercury(II) reductase [Hydrogenibacillus schlegelii]|uniref:Mercuric reductase n=1 Tax=Hydrogenibacillus schlegelii TaxID=1484 RepID=A0A947G9P4_HYDSH|nr:mercury(II) reductase [Hydrogenibacillus schlegelii]
MARDAVFRLAVRGMSRKGGERAVARTLEAAEARELAVDVRHGEVRFALPDGGSLAGVRSAVRAAGYTPGEAARRTADAGERPASPEVDGGVRPANEGDGSVPANVDGPPALRPESRRVRPPKRDPDAFDLVLVGSGAAAFAAGIEAVRRGARVAMVERGVVGGTCVNVGCIPSKLLLRAGTVRDRAQHPPYDGLGTSAGAVDLPRLIAAKDALVAELRRDKYERLIDHYGFTLLRGEGRFRDAATLEVDGRPVRGRAYVVATGRRPAVPEIPGLAAVDFLTGETLLSLRHPPEHLIVIGSGMIALELGLTVRLLGSRVTVLGRGTRLLPTEEPEASAALLRALEQKGIAFLLGARIGRVEEAAGRTRVLGEKDGQPFAVEGDALLVATGRRPNTEALSLERAGVAVGSRGEIVVDARLRTSAPHIYAAGDVTGLPPFVYVAAHAGAVAAENALGGERTAALEAVPRVLFTSPALARVGLTEAEARRMGRAVRTATLDLGQVPRAIVGRETDGVFKLVVDAPTGRLLGASVVAEDAGEVIAAATLAVRAGLTVRDLRETLFPYLTMAEGLKLAALAFDVDVRRLSCCAG